MCTYERKNKMENIKTKIAIVIVILLIIALIAVSYLYSDYNIKQLELLTTEVNKILEVDLSKQDIDLKNKTERNYAEVEDSVKEYILRLKNIYVEMEQLASGINPNSIFAAQNMPDKKFDEIENIIDEYKNKSQNLITEYEELIDEEKIKENIRDAHFSIKKEYYINLYNEIMLSETMKNQFLELDEQIKNEKGRLYEKLNKIEKMREFLEEYDESWKIEEGKIQFTNLIRMTEYYNLLNQIID